MGADQYQYRLLYILMISSAVGLRRDHRRLGFQLKYSFLGARASAQSISYEIAMSAVLVCVVMVSGSMNFSDIAAQAKGIAGGSVFSGTGCRSSQSSSSI